MQTHTLPRSRAVRALTAALLALPGTGLFAAATNSDAFPRFDSYVKVAGSAADITGDTSAFQARSGQAEPGSGGIEALHYGWGLPKDVELTMEGRALGGAQDYLLSFQLAKEEVGSVTVGYETFRTFYNGVGGFFPNNSVWLPLDDQELFVDRGKFWAEAKIARPDKPEFTLRYANSTRDGRKDSTSWGTTTVTGVTPTTSTTRNLNASYLDLDERHQSLEGVMKHTVGNTTYRLSLLGDWVDNLDSKHMQQMPLAATPATRSTITQIDGAETKTLGVMTNTSTELNDTVTVNTGLRYQKVAHDFTGERRLVSGAGVTTYNYFDLAGQSDAKIYNGNIGVDLTPTADWLISPCLRMERRRTETDATFRTGTPATPTPQIEYSSNEEDSLTPTLDARYTGVRNLALYASAAQRLTKGEKDYVTSFNPNTPPAVIPLYASDFENDRDSYKVGANWRQSGMLTLRGEVFYKEQGYTSLGTLPTGAPTHYELGSEFTGYSTSVILRPHQTLTSTTRYTYQEGQRMVTHFKTTPPQPARTTLLEVDAMDAVVHRIGETIDWTPVQQFYAQASVDFVFDTMSTAYPKAGLPANNVLRDSENDYFTGSLLFGFVLTKRDDVQVQFTYYRADNGNLELATDTVPYGVSEEESVVTVGLTHKFTDNLMGSIKLGYADFNSDTTGGRTDFRGPLGYVSLTYGL
ncbi:MAG: hypothetical protein MUE42_04370 [Opitutaceae bacterium]|nr:hypothetical protein [Opitutaceae bacterium]